MKKTQVEKVLLSACFDVMLLSALHHPWHVLTLLTIRSQPHPTALHQPLSRHPPHLTFPAHLHTCFLLLQCVHTGSFLLVPSQSVYCASCFPAFFLPAWLCLCDLRPGRWTSVSLLGPFCFRCICLFWPAFLVLTFSCFWLKVPATEPNHSLGSSMFFSEPSQDHVSWSLISLLVDTSKQNSFCITLLDTLPFVAKTCNKNVHDFFSIGYIVKEVSSP